MDSPQASDTAASLPVTSDKSSYSISVVIEMLPVRHGSTTYSIPLTDKDTMESVKCKVGELAGLEVSTVKLITKGKLLSDDLNSNQLKELSSTKIIAVGTRVSNAIAEDVLSVHDPLVKDDISGVKIKRKYAVSVAGNFLKKV